MLTWTEISDHLDRLAKPPGSLGRLEACATRLAFLQGTLKPETQPRQLTIFVADHAVTAAGVSAWPATLTAQITALLLQGLAAGSILARQTQTRLVVVDVGLFEPIPVSWLQQHRHAAVDWQDHRVRAGSRNWAHTPALLETEFDQAWQVGANLAEACSKAGLKLLLGGEVGIGNTTAAACWTALLTGAEATACVGPGAGAEPEQWQRKRQVVHQALQRWQPSFKQSQSAAKRALAAVAGLEMVALAGYFATAAAWKIPILLDGMVATSAAAVAAYFQPTCQAYLLAAHRSPEPAHPILLAHLGLEPILEGWQMRLGEGTGALLALPLLDAAAAILRELPPLEVITAKSN